MKRLVLLAFALSGAATSTAGDASWAELARNDLRALHDLLRDNHPGPVDPENGRYRDWLQTGLREALRRARGARGWADYVRVLRFYTNGVQDGHLGSGLELSPERMEWPGFVVGAAADGTAEVLGAQPDSGVQAGDRLTGCDGRSLDVLMKERVDPYFWNTAIPH